MNNLEIAKQTWDDIDIDKVRDVSWFGIKYFEEKMVRNFTNNGSLLLDNLLISRNTDHTKLKGSALVCGDMTGEQDYFKNRSGISFEHVDGFDLSAESLNRFTSNHFKFTPHAIDANDIILEEATYVT